MRQSEDKGSPTDWAIDNAKWLATIALFLIIVIKVLVVSDLNPTTALGLADAAGAPRVAFSVLIFGLPVLLLGLMFPLLYASFSVRNSVYIRVPAFILYVLLIIIAALTLPRGLVIVMLVLSAPTLLVGVSLLRKTPMATTPIPTTPASPNPPSQTVEGASERDVQEAGGREGDSIATRLGELEGVVLEWVDNKERAEFFERDLLPLLQRIELALQALRQAVNTATEEQLARAEELAVEQHRIKHALEAQWQDPIVPAPHPLLPVLWMPVIVMVVSVLFGFLNRDVWLPLESLSVTSQPEPVVGYVISTSGDWFAVLLEEDRALKYYAKSSVVGRNICRTARAGGSSTSPNAGNPLEKYPECP